MIVENLRYESKVFIPEFYWTGSFLFQIILLRVYIFMIFRRELSGTKFAPRVFLLIQIMDICTCYVKFYIFKMSYVFPDHVALSYLHKTALFVNTWILILMLWAVASHCYFVLSYWKSVFPLLSVTFVSFFLGWSTYRFRTQYVILTLSGGWEVGVGAFGYY